MDSMLEVRKCWYENDAVPMMILLKGVGDIGAL